MRAHLKKARGSYEMGKELSILACDSAYTFLNFTNEEFSGSVGIYGKYEIKFVVYFFYRSRARNGTGTVHTRTSKNAFTCADTLAALGVTEFSMLTQQR
jgi:hypothetical protein